MRISIILSVFLFALPVFSICYTGSVPCGTACCPTTLTPNNPTYCADAAISLCCPVGRVNVGGICCLPEQSNVGGECICPVGSTECGTTCCKGICRFFKRVKKDGSDVVCPLEEGSCPGPVCLP